MVNPHDTPSPHSGDWDEREKADERSLSRPSGGSGYTRPPTDWSRVNNSNTYRSNNTGTGTGYVPQKGRSRKIAAGIISVFFIAIIGMFLFGDGSFDSLTQISIPLGDITEQIFDTIQPCKVYDSIQITKVASQGTISLMSCSIENKDVLTVSGDLSKSAQVHLTLLNPDMKKIQEVTFVKKEFSHIIGKELYSKDAGEWRINVIVNGKDQGILMFMKN
jgi:hypothetical protein